MKPSAPRIAPIHKRGKEKFEVRWSTGHGPCRRRLFDTREEAEEELASITELKDSGSPSLVSYAPEDRAAFGQILKPYPGLTLTEVAQFYVQHHTPSFMLEANVPKLIPLFLASKDDLSKRHREELRQHLASFQKEFGSLLLGGISLAHLEAYVNNISACAKTRLNHLITLRTFFKWAKRHGYLPPNMETVADQIDRPKVVKKSHAVFASDALMDLLANSSTKLLPWLLLGAFAGVRSSEALRLTASHWHADTGTLVLDSDITKTGRRRSVDTTPNFTDWMRPLIPDDKSGKLVRCNPYVEKSSKGWVNNGLRAGYVSNHVSHFNDLALTAKNAGHSVSVLQTEYLHLTSKEEAKNWFSITPESVLDYCYQKGITPEWKGLYSPVPSPS